MSGVDHLTVSLEIEDPNAVKGHHHSMREIQRLQVSQENKRDTMQVSISNPDGGTFALTFTNPVTGGTWTGAAISTRATEYTFQ